jgi:phage shock protein PspC (stress-responsive transcriptional regulator)
MRWTARSRKLCKDPLNGWIFGICAGIAWWLGVKIWVIRLLAVLGLVFLTGPTLMVYAVAALVLNKRPRTARDAAEERHARAFGDRPGRGWSFRYDDARRDDNRWDDSRWDGTGRQGRERGW